MTTTVVVVAAANVVIVDTMTSTREDIGKIASSHLLRQWRPTYRSL